MLPLDPCNPSPCSANGQCRVVNGQAVCTYPECLINQDCSSDKACYNQHCRDPCIGACGVNAICNVVNHNPVCSCPPGYEGPSRIACRLRAPVVELPRPECTDNSDCTNDKACINQKCVDPCKENPNSCARNAECRVQLHRPTCSCREGFSGNAQSYCFESKHLKSRNMLYNFSNNNR